MLGSRLGMNWEGRPAALPSPAARGRCPAALRPPGEEAPPLPPRCAGGAAAGTWEEAASAELEEELEGEGTKWERKERV